MKTTLLLPHKLRYVGWIFFALGIVLTILFYDTQPNFLDFNVFALVDSGIGDEISFFNIIEDNIANEILGIVHILGLVMIAFSKEKTEDELINSIRLNSMIWAVYFNFIILFISFFTVFGTAFFTFMQINLFSVLLIFILRFRYLIWKFKNSLGHEK